MSPVSPSFDAASSAALRTHWPSRCGSLSVTLRNTQAACTVASQLTL